MRLAPLLLLALSFGFSVCAAYCCVRSWRSLSRASEHAGRAAVHCDRAMAHLNSAQVTCRAIIAELERARGLCAVVALLALSGCATGTLDCTDLRQGACKVSFQRFGTDTAATFTGPDGLGFTYSSNPNAAATAEAFAAINRLAGLVGTVRPLVPLVPAPAQPALPSDDSDDAAFIVPRARPPMIDGVAHALEL